MSHNVNNYLGFKVEFGYDAAEDMIIASVPELEVAVSGANHEHALFNLMIVVNLHIDTKF